MAEEMTEEEVGNVVYVGNKPVMNYVLAVVTQMNGGAEVVSLKARGRAISRAVDVAEIVRNRFMPNVEIEDINISTEEIVGNDGTTTNVSAIEIRLKILIQNKGVSPLYINFLNSFSKIFWYYFSVVFSI